jgi:hypothetical protein
VAPSLYETGYPGFKNPASRSYARGFITTAPFPVRGWGAFSHQRQLFGEILGVSDRSLY